MPVKADGGRIRHLFSRIRHNEFAATLHGLIINNDPFSSG
jgi:hypothetical protein